MGGAREAKKMRPIAATVGIVLACVAAGVSHGQTTDTPTEPTKSRVYALIAALGEDFTVVTETSRAGSHLSPYRRHTSKVQDNVLNRLALHSLDKAIGTIDPSSTRIYMSLALAKVDSVPPSGRDSAALGAITAELARMPQRLDWDRIVVATPAFRALDRDGMPSKLQGFGIFSEPQCQGGCPGLGRIPRHVQPEPADGADAVTSDNKTIKASTYLAPYSYIEVWILDPKTLEILDVQQGFDSQKLAEPRYKAPLDLTESEAQKYLAGRIVTLIEMSVGVAVMHSEVNVPRGRADAGPIRRIDPDELSVPGPRVPE
jgi:hypothetical protein